MPKIVLSGHTFHYNLIRKPIRTIRLRLLSRRRFQVSASRKPSLSIIEDFIHQNEIWIFKNSQKLPAIKKLRDSKSLKLLGETWKVIYLPSSVNKIRLDEAKQEIIIMATNLTNSNLSTLFSKVFRPFALKVITDELIELQKEFDFSYGTVRVRNQSTRYGSCSFQNNLNFNWQIIFFPYEQFRHILLHELVHTKVKNHSKKFWQTLALYDPNYLFNRRWLKSDGSKHYLIK